MMRSSRLLPLSLGMLLLLGLGWFGYLRARGPALDRQLMMAVSRGNLPKATELLAQGANPNAHDPRSGSALAWTVHTKNAPMCKLLLEHGAEVKNARSFSGEPLFLTAVGFGDPEIVKAFLAKGADPRMPRGPHPGGAPVAGGGRMRGTPFLESYSPLRMAAQQGHVAVLKVLLEAGVPVDEESPTHYTALMEAVEHDRDAAVKFLIARGANVEHRQRLETPLIRACRMGKRKAARVLIAAGADVNARDRSRWTPVLWAARRMDLSTLPLLVAKGAEIDARDGGGQTALMWAAIYGNPNVAQWLLARGADPTLQTPRKERALEIARRYRRDDVVKLLQAATGERELALRKDEG